MIGLTDLEGRWQVRRRIEDRLAGVTGFLEGEAVWSPDQAGLRQVEVGVLRYGAAPPMQATRAYLWRAEAGGLAVFFDDGRPFHRLAEGRLTDRHLCDPDTYDVSYNFADWPSWRQVWHVKGPRKNAVITSKFFPHGVD